MLLVMIFCSLECEVHRATIEIMRSVIENWRNQRHLSHLCHDFVGLCDDIDSSNNCKRLP